MQRLRLVDMCIDGFSVPNTWRNLQSLDLDENWMTELPGNLSALVSLQFLTIDDQDADLQVMQPMNFSTQLQDLQGVHLSASRPGCFWNAASLFALMTGKLWIQKAADCHVTLYD